MQTNNYYALLTQLQNLTITGALTCTATADAITFTPVDTHSLSITDWAGTADVTHLTLTNDTVTGFDLHYHLNFTCNLDAFYSLSTINTYAKESLMQ